MTSLSLIGFTLDILGKVLLGLSVYFVHARVAKERKIDRHVVLLMRQERNMVVIGILLMVAGYFMQLPGKI